MFLARLRISKFLKAHFGIILSVKNLCLKNFSTLIKCVCSKGKRLMFARNNKNNKLEGGCYEQVK